MRVILIGPADERRRLRARVPASIEIVGEAPTAAAARSLHLEVEADALLSSASPSFAIEGDDGETAVEPLTPRELEVLALMAEGLSNKGIADRLAISDQTVKFHVASIGGKLNALNRTDAVRRGLRRGLISL
jgi:DNA-binding NarL/FixJ family response regulator